MSRSESGASERDGAILVVGALGREIAPLARRLESARRESVGRLRVTRGELSGREVAVIAAGDGQRAAERGLAAALERLEVAAVLGVGVAGGLSPQLAVGDLVLADGVEDREGRVFEPPLWSWSERARECVGRCGRVVSAEEIVGPASAKEGLWRQLGSPANAVVDLESATWARLAAQAELPWLILRAVSDPAGEDLPVDFNRFRGADGRIKSRKVAAHALAHPSVVRPLQELAARIGPCAERLAARAEEILAW